MHLLACLHLSEPHKFKLEVTIKNAFASVTEETSSQLLHLLTQIRPQTVFKFTTNRLIKQEQVHDTIISC